MTLSDDLTLFERWDFKPSDNLFLAQNLGNRGFLGATSDSLIKINGRGSDWERWTLTSGLSQDISIETNTWISFLADDRLLSSLSIPGTRESYSRMSGIFLEDSKCQKKNVPIQLQQGVRYINVFLREDQDKLLIYHHQGVSFFYHYNS